MFNIAKMDIYRVFRSTSFYISLIFILMMGFGMSAGQEQLTLNNLMGIPGNVSPDDAFMMSMMGSGTLSIILSVILSLFVHSDFSSGYIKNIFSIHSNIKDYFFGRMISLSILSLLFQFIYLIIAVLALTTFMGEVTIEGTILGLTLFIIEKWLLSIAFIALILLIMLMSRKGVWGIISGFIVGTGGISMMLPSLASILHINALSMIQPLTISGTSSLLTFSTNFSQFMHVFLVSVCWLSLSTILTFVISKQKDIL